MRWLWKQQLILLIFEEVCTLWYLFRMYIQHMLYKLIQLYNIYGHYVPIYYSHTTSLIIHLFTIHTPLFPKNGKSWTHTCSYYSAVPSPNTLFNTYLNWSLSTGLPTIYGNIIPTSIQFARVISLVFPLKATNRVDDHGRRKRN